MDFIDVASYFDDDPVYDAYTGVLLFYCHTAAHDDHTSSGATSRRRTMTTVNGTVPPARRVVMLYGEPWLLSNSNPDGFQGYQIRRSYGLKKSTGLVALLTPGQACTGAAGTPFHAHREYFRDNGNARTESEWDTMWNVFCPPSEAVTKGMFLRQGASLMRARNCYPTIEDLDIAEADQFDADAAQSVTFSTGTLNLVTDTYDTATLSVPAIQTDNQKFYRFRTEAEGLQQPGDRTVFVPQAAVTPKVGGQFSMLGAEWRIVSVVPELDSWAIQARLA